MTPALICHFCDDPLEETEVGAISGAIVVCQDCAAVAEPEEAQQ